MSDIILYDSEQAAKKVTVTGWASRQGRFYGDEEHLARWDGCTHKKCEDCGELMEIRSWCRSCRKKKREEKYYSFPEVIWDRKTPLCIFDTDTFFWNEDDLEYYCEDNKCAPQDLQLVICHPQYAQLIEPNDCYDDILPQDQSIEEVAPELAAAFDALNKVIQDYAKPLSWIGGNKRTKFTLSTPAQGGDDAIHP